MTNNYDRSYKDKKYFINGSIYNCPFCKRGHVKYEIIEKGSYNSSNIKTVYYYIVRCNDCARTSFHLSKYELNSWYNQFDFPPRQIIIESSTIPNSPRQKKITEIVHEDGSVIKELDDAFYYHDPSSFFTIDERIPSQIRAALGEAIGSLKSNFLTSSSGCLRKAIYKLLKCENIPEKDMQTGKYFSHDERVTLLKTKHPKIDSELLDELRPIHILTSQELHENDWEDFDSPNLRYLIEIVKDILHKIYIAPLEQIKRREELLKLQKMAQIKNRKKLSYVLNDAK